MDRQRPTTEDAAAKPAVPEPPDPAAVKSGVKLPLKVAELRRKLGQKAKQEPDFRFYALYDRVYRLDVLAAAWWLVWENDGAPGVDGLSCQDIIDGPGAGPFCEQMAEELRTKTCRPGYPPAGAVKRVDIPQPDGRLRPGGIPPVKDPIVQTAVLLVREPIFEADFLDSSFGYRPGKSAHQAIDRIAEYLSAGFREVSDADLKRAPGGRSCRVPGRFASIPHDQLMKCVERRVSDRSVLKLIRMWLSAPIVETDERGHKTKVVDLKEPGASLDFLSFTFRYDRDLYGRGYRYLNVFPSKKALAPARQQLRQRTGKRQCLRPIPDLLGSVNWWLRGWGYYFRHGYPQKAFREINWFTIRRLVRHLERRSQRPYRAPEGVSFYAHLQAWGLRLL